MTFRIIVPAERLSENYNKVTAAIFGRAKVGKTTLVKTLDPMSTLFCNLEAGMKSVQGFKGAHIDIETWEDATDAACLFGGIDKSAGPSQYYNAHHYDYVRTKYPDINPDWFKTLFWDSVTDLTRLAMTWARQQPGAFNKYGKPDLRGAYGLLGIEVVRLLRHVQHTPGKNVIYVGGLDHYLDEANRDVYAMQSEGNKTKSELPFIVDQVITMSDFDFVPGYGIVHNFEKGQHRALCCKSPNPWGLPAGDRSGNLDTIEEPHLGRLIEKINRVSA